jgi:tetratricopeptide (TPR) repeat protein
MLKNSKKSGRNTNAAARKAKASWSLLLGAVLAAALPSASWAQEFCGDLTNAFGPFDYTDPTTKVVPPSGGETRIGIVERAHFTPEVEQLIRGKSSTIVDDIDYTLRAFPNHHRALYSMARYYLANSKFGEQLGRYSMECWFDRAMRMNPNDGVVPAIWGVYLAKKGDKEGALAQYKRALEIMPDFGEAHYNIGLLYLGMKKYDLANEHAVAAYKSGFPLPYLRTRLQELGVWKPGDGQ